jgi:hypothetical protein
MGQNPGSIIIKNEKSKEASPGTTDDDSTMRFGRYEIHSFQSSLAAFEDNPCLSLLFLLQRTMKRPIASNPSSGNNNNNNYRSYQQGGNQYQPPVHYASDQTAVLEDTSKAYYQADETAAAVLQSMTAQKQQIKSGSDNVWEMRQATEKAKRELQLLHSKYQQKKQRLYLTIAILALTDMFCFFRILQCRGNFFC